MSIQDERNEHEKFQRKFGDYTTYELNREQVLDGFYAAYRKQKGLEHLVLVEDPSKLEDDLYEYFSEEGGWTDSVLDLLRAPLSDPGSGDDYAEFMDDFEIEPTEEQLLYRCRYDP